MKKIRDKLGLGPHGVETDAHATRYRYLRRDAERVLVRQLGHMDVAVLETAWLLPVNGEAESEKDIVHEKVAALCPPKDRPTFPVRPELNEDLKPQLNAREARRFFVSLAKALRLDSKASGTPHR
jgi:hypothetical protein